VCTFLPTPVDKSVEDAVEGDAAPTRSLAARGGLIAGAVVCWAVVVAAVAYLRGRFRAAHAPHAPGASGVLDALVSVPWLVVPIYCAPARVPQQCGWAYQLALMERASLVRNAASGYSRDSEDAAAAAPLTGAAAPPAPGGGAWAYPPGGAPGAWSTPLLGCAPPWEFEGDCPIFYCACTNSWWLQARLLKRLGRFPLAAFVQWALGLCLLEYAPVLVDEALVGAAGPGLVAAGWALSVPSYAVTCWTRRALKQAHGIEGGGCGRGLVDDVCPVVFCYPCAMAQMDRELTARGAAV
jgi:Cys-rich protein (TIGR01571 family)